MRLFVVAACAVAAILAGCGADSSVREDMLGAWSGDVPGTTEVSVYRGYEHCETQDLFELQIHHQPSGERSFYLRDEGGAMGAFSPHARERFDELDRLPPEALDSGFSRAGVRLHLEPDGSAAYFVFKDGIERWPRWDSSLTYCD